jgi:peptide chain release factor subunit 1
MKNEPCSECKSMDAELINQDLVDYIALIASQTGTKVEVVSGKTEHGVMLGSLGNIAAILRYNPNRT